MDGRSSQAAVGQPFHSRPATKAIADDPTANATPQDIPDPSNRDSQNRTSDLLKYHGTAMLSEFVGTLLFLMLALAASQTAKNLGPQVESGTYIYIALGVSLSLIFSVWSFNRVGGGLFNPSVTLALCIVKYINPTRCALLSFSQYAAGIAGAGLCRALLPHDVDLRPMLSPSTSIVQGAFVELILTAEIVLCTILLVVEKQKATNLAPLGIGLTVFVSELVDLPSSGASFNPAISLGTAAAAREFRTYHWIYFVNLLGGGCIASAFYLMMKRLRYEEVDADLDLVHTD